MVDSLLAKTPPPSSPFALTVLLSFSPVSLITPNSLLRGKVEFEVGGIAPPPDPVPPPPVEEMDALRLAFALLNHPEVRLRVLLDRLSPFGLEEVEVI